MRKSTFCENKRKPQDASRASSLASTNEYRICSLAHFPNLQPDIDYGTVALQVDGGLKGRVPAFTKPLFYRFIVLITFIHIKARVIVQNLSILHIDKTMLLTSRYKSIRWYEFTYLNERTFTNKKEAVTDKCPQLSHFTEPTSPCLPVRGFPSCGTIFATISQYSGVIRHEPWRSRPVSRLQQHSQQFRGSSSQTSSY